MAHLYKCVEWEGVTGVWYVNDVQDLKGVSSRWWTPVSMLGITPSEYVLLLINKFNVAVEDIHYYRENNVLLFSFKTQAAARLYKNWINKEARNRKYYV